MLIQSIQLNNFLSFGTLSPAIPLLPLNIIIGPKEMLIKSPGATLAHSGVSGSQKAS